MEKVRNAYNITGRKPDRINKTKKKVKNDLEKLKYGETFSPLTHMLEETSVADIFIIITQHLLSYDDAYGAAFHNSCVPYSDVFHNIYVLLHMKHPSPI